MNEKYLLTYLDSDNKPNYNWFISLEEMQHFIDSSYGTVIDKMRILQYIDLRDK